MIFYLNSSFIIHHYKKSDSLSLFLMESGGTYLPGPSPAKYFRRSFCVRDENRWIPPAVFSEICCASEVLLCNVSKSNKATRLLGCFLLWNPAEPIFPGRRQPSIFGAWRARRKPKRHQALTKIYVQRQGEAVIA